MSDGAAAAALTLTFCAIILAAMSIIVSAWQSGSLQADVKWAQKYLAIQFAHLKKTNTN